MQVIIIHVQYSELKMACRNGSKQRANKENKNRKMYSVMPSHSQTLIAGADLGRSLLSLTSRVHFHVEARLVVTLSARCPSTCE